MIRKRLLFFILALLTLSIIYFVFWLVKTDLLVKEKFASGHFVAPTQFYSSSLELSLNQPFSPATLLQNLQSHQYREKPWGSRLQISDFSMSQGTDCEKIYSASIKCFAFYHHLQKKIHIVAADELDRVLVLLEVDPETQQSRNLTTLLLFPELFAQYFGDKPILQDRVPLHQVPRLCLDAVLSVEDPHFLDHQGLSWRGLLRAFWVNIKSGRAAQGGSTITQQLVKNYFLTSEKKFSRKIKEMIIALLVERAIQKDQILETYLNIIYLGQQGNYQIHGYAAASRFYFQKSVEELDLSECALLGAIVNNPGVFNPFRNQERALQRRTKVLTAMVEQERILDEDKEKAMQKALPQKNLVEVRETAPYFIDAVIKNLRREGFIDLSGFKIFTTLDLHAQQAAQQAVQNHLKTLEESSAYHRDQKKHSLQSVLIADHPQTGAVLALVGGRDHRKTPYNRALESHRQIGSLFKPLVYLSAFENIEDFSPLTELTNRRFEYVSHGQKWSPKNYDGTTSEKVPAFYALKESLNIPTAQLGLDVGLEKIIRDSEELGATSEMKPFASLSLGAFEMTPWEVLQIYTNIARRGSLKPLRLIHKVETLEGEQIWSPLESSEEQVLHASSFVNVISILQEAIKTGTGQAAQKMGLNLETAGKTGTTTDYKDAWFAGFTENHVAVVWTGYDDNTPVKLTGAAASLPIWVDYMKNTTTVIEPMPFVWPEQNVKTLSLSPEELVELGVPVNKALPTQLLFAPQ